MDLIIHLSQMADYNQWSNQNLLKACRSLDKVALHEDRGAFFQSIMGTLNHIMVADLMWLRRFQQAHELGAEALLALKRLKQFPATQQLDQTLFDELDEFADERVALDQLILDWIDSLDSNHLNLAFTYRNSKGVESTRPLGLVLSHFFNHQTHHRGQLGTLLYQSGVNPGVTDLLVRIPEVEV